MQDDSSLVISKTDEDDNARYTCNAESVTGKDSTSSVVKVVGKSLTSIWYFLSLLRQNAARCCCTDQTSQLKEQCFHSSTNKARN